MKIIYMGTPDFAVAPLKKLYESGYEIAAVITVPDKPAGRGQKLRLSPVKIFAEKHGLKVLQPEKLRAPDFIAQLEEIKPDLAVVVAFRMLPKVVWSIPKIGTFNLHASLLPDYRGAAPINWVLINGETQSGATTFFINEEIDTGKLLLQEKIDIPKSWNAGNLHDALMNLGAELVLKTVEGLEEGGLEAKTQDDDLFVHAAPKIFKQDCEIKWEQDANLVYNFVRGLSPYPTAWTTLGSKTMKVYKVTIDQSLPLASPGTMRILQDRWLCAVKDGWLEFLEIQLEGKKRMSADDFLRGYGRLVNEFIETQSQSSD